MGLFWAESDQPVTAPSRASQRPSPGQASTSPSSCPINHTKSSAALACPRPEASSKPSACPVKHDAAPSNPTRKSTIAALNPLNWMPHDLPQTKESSLQKTVLPVEREISSIPRADQASKGNWEYPSPQQMYNALVRKGYTDTPEDAVESMVAIHNFLNEGAWAEIVEWERRFGKGLGQGWRECRFGEEGSQVGAMTLPAPGSDIPEPKLIRFEGRAQDVTPKARMLQVLGWMYPSKYGTEPPFDRHDWYVERQLPSGQLRKVRYVIDYYSGAPEPSGQPVFFLDIRPALDRPAAPAERIIRWGRDFWWRASGGSARQQQWRS